ncbi:MAG: hypothetical protein ACO4CI_09305 [Phycisphaerales bacterium]
MRTAGIGLLIVSVLAASACAPRKVRVEVAANDAGTVRTFATNRLDREEAARVESLYGSGSARSAGGETAFTASFDESLPSEIGNRNGLSEIRTSLGVAKFYWESFDPAEDHWSDLEYRMASGELWGRIFGRWAEMRIEDESRREEFNAVLEREYLPLARDTMLMWSAMQAASQAQRVAARVRDAKDRGAMSDDERFRRAVFLPLLLLLAERGFFTPEEIQRLILLSAKGNPSEAERRWSFAEVIAPALQRQFRRFDPEAAPPTFPSLLASGVSFYLFASNSSRIDDLMLASPVIPDADKERIRRGDRSVALPPVFGVRVGNRAKPTETEVVLATGVEPYLTNGAWDAETKSVVFKGRIVEGRERITLYAATFQAAWAIPDEAFQRKCFGEVLLEGEALAGYCGWLQALPEKPRARWDAALEALADTGDRKPLREACSSLKRNFGVPEAIERWLDGAA